MKNSNYISSLEWGVERLSKLQKINQTSIICFLTQVENEESVVIKIQSTLTQNIRKKEGVNSLKQKTQQSQLKQKNPPSQFGKRRSKSYGSRTQKIQQLCRNFDICSQRKNPKKTVQKSQKKILPVSLENEGRSLMGVVPKKSNGFAEILISVLKKRNPPSQFGKRRSKSNGRRTQRIQRLCRNFDICSGFYAYLHDIL